MATIANNSVVAIKYVLTADDGEELDRSQEDSPLTYLHGHHNIVPGLEKALLGKSVGDKVKAVVPPEEAYGQRVGKSQRVPRSQFPKDLDLKPGMQLAMQTQDGQMAPIWIERIQGPTVIVDMNHPLAGETLHFDVEVMEIREASEEEIQHGHVHGPHGHGH